MKFVVVLDVNPSVAGMSGDMLSAALLNVIDDPEGVIQQFQQMLISIHEDFSIKLQEKHYQGFRGVHLSLSGEKYRMNIPDLLTYYKSFADELGISDIYRAFGKDVLQTLIDAEKSVHQSEDAHLHELGTLDTLLDIILPTYLLQLLGVNRIILHPVATGSGTVKTAHGRLPVPAPATQHILETANLETRIGPSGEATTPTGASLLASLKKHFQKAENVIWEKSGFGFGSLHFENRGNFIRIRLGKLTSEYSTISVLETNLDDISGEILGDAMERLLEEGALDVNYTPIFTKKNRPGYTLRVLTPTIDADRLGSRIMELTGSLGVRVIQIKRHLGKRSIRKQKLFIPEWDKEVVVRIKKGFRSKVEFDDIERIATELELTPLKVSEILYKYLEEDE